MDNINTFNRRVKLKSHFGETPPKEGLYFKSDSNWEPPNPHYTVKTFTENFKNNMKKSLEKKPNDENRNKQIKNLNEQDKKLYNENKNKKINNLNKNEQEALEALKKREDLIFTNADKGGALVINTVKAYMDEANRQLANSNHYEKLDHNPTSEHAALVENAIETLKLDGKLDEKIAEQLKPRNPRTPRMYLLPKIHKPGNPGRPVVSSIGCHTERISKYVDHYLQPINQSLPSYVKDTTNFLNKLDSLPEELPDDAIMVTMDVRSLYTNVPNNEGIEAVKHFLRTRNRPGDGILAKVISTFLLLILTLNNFVFNETNYIQVNGASMGTKCAPTYASIFMGLFEQSHILPRIQEHILMYVRYIDDIFFIWRGSEAELKKFLDTINTLHPSIKFDYEHSRTKSVFLDCRIQIVNRKIKTSVYSKPTDRKAYVHQKSFHPRSTKESIAYGQALRLRRICTDDVDFREAATKLELDLIKRGYDRTKTAGEIEKAARKERRELLTYNERSEDRRIPLVVTYDNRLPDIKKIVNDSWSILQINEAESRKFTEKPRVCFRRNKNLRDVLGQTKLVGGKVARTTGKQSGRCTPCRGRAKAQCCTHVVNTSVFTDGSGRKRFKIRQKTGCRSTNAIYLAWCDRCNDGKQYVGKVEKQQTNRRINKHRFDSKQADSIKIDQHFRSANHTFDDFRIIVIEEIEQQKTMTKEQIRTALLRREDFWVKQLGTLEPRGYNEKLNFPSQA